MPTQSIQVRFQGKTTYILGAGFSAAAGIPTMNNFLPTAFELLKRYEKDCYADASLTVGLARLIDSKRAVAANSDLDVHNIEDLFCLVEQTSDSGAKQEGGVSRERDAGKRKQSGVATREPHGLLIDVIISTLCLAYLQQEVLLRKADEELVRLIREKLQGRNETLTQPKACECTVPQRHLFLPNEIRYLGKPCDSTFNICAYEAFWSYVLDCQAKRQGTGGLPSTPFEADAIITPNYDMVLEEKLRHFQDAKIFYGDGVDDSPCDLLFLKGWSSDSEAKIGIPVVKLHGSINWRHRARKTLSGGHGSGVPRVIRRKPPFVEVWEPIKQARSWVTAPGPLRPLEAIPLQPPTWRKEPIHGGLFELLARQAIRHLRTAERIVVIGYSMPPTDFYLRSLLAEGLDTPERPTIEVWDISSRQKMEERLLTMFGKSNVSRIRFESTGFLGFVKDKVNPHSLGGNLTRLSGEGEAKPEKERGES